MSVAMPFQHSLQAKRVASLRAETEQPEIAVQDEHPLNRKAIILRVPLDEVALKQAQKEAAISKPPKAQLSTSPFSKRQAYLNQPEQDMLHINQRPTAAQDAERAKANLKKNRTLRNIGILGLTAIGGIAVTFAALKTYVWGDK